MQNLPIYLDVNIYRDYLEERTNREGKDLEEKAWNIFARTISCEFKIVISDVLINQLAHQITPGKSQFLLELLKSKGKLVMVNVTVEDKKKANKLSTNYEDALHAVVAARAGAELLVTRNIRDFLPFNHLIKAKLPENL